MNCIFVCPRNTCPVFSTFPNTHKGRKKKTGLRENFVFLFYHNFFFSSTGLLPECLCLIASNSSFMRLSSLHFTSRSGAANKLSKTMPEEKKRKRKKEGSHLGSFGILFIAAVKLSGNAAVNIVS
ncbi:hypothetical protein CEXT_456051 [Caerostris extrusa]|uniref:Transmembrane protein n=1 Tax=Caerostris extrusa TaxID=172846 RepID=A0AAV4YFY3_CAEEX|nr:hypothetical protein CEXT_456051 [Caerostris extrusa]